MLNGKQSRFAIWFADSLLQTKLIEKHISRYRKIMIFQSFLLQFVLFVGNYSTSLFYWKELYCCFIAKNYRHHWLMWNYDGNRLWTSFNSTQRTTHQSEWITRGKKLKAYLYPRFLKCQSNFLLKFSTLLQRNNAAGRPFHTSTIVIEKKCLHISKWTCGSYTLSSWPLSSVLTIVKKSLCWILLIPLKILKTWIRSPLSLLVSNVVIFNLLSLSLYDKPLSPIISGVAVFCTFSSKSMSFLK